jgi:integrase
MTPWFLPLLSRCWKRGPRQVWMRIKLTKRMVEAIAVGEADVLVWDDTLRGFGVKVTPKGARVYVLQYSFGGRSRRVTIGRHGELTVEEARRKALVLRAAVANGADPAGVRATDRAVPLLAEFAQRYLSEHAAVKKKPLSLAADERNLRNHILPAMGRLKVSAIARGDVVRFHQSMKAKPGAANRCLALLSKMFNLAEKWGIRPDGSNLCRHVEKYPERSLERFLSLAELARLGAALREAEGKGEHPSVIGALRLLTFTGCRRNEILTLRWEHVDLAGGCLRLPSSKTGKRVVPLGAPALAVLAALPRREGNPFVLPGNSPGGHYVAVEKAWRRLRERAELGDVRLHDLRHSFASAAAAMGEGLPVIGALLGHADQSTTKRYTHFSNDPLRAAADRISGTIAAAFGDASESGRDAGGLPAEGSSPGGNHVGRE